MNLTMSSDILDAQIRIFNFRNLRRLDWQLVVLIFALAGAGILVHLSANRGVVTGSPYYLKQMTFFAAGCVLAIVIACLDYRFLISMAPALYLVIIGLLVAVLLVGVKVNGATRWLDLGFIRFQPSEQAKLALIFALAWYLGKIGPKIQKLPYFLLTFVIAAVPTLLIRQQPNLGTAATMAPIVFVMLFVAGCSRRHLIAICVTGLACLPILWSQMSPYQRGRVQTFLNPEADPMEGGWHVMQSIITVGSGGMSGKGFQQGTQTYLSYLPEYHTDFIFSQVAEEFGFIGSTVVLILFALLFLRALQFAKESLDMTGALLVSGVVALLSFHVFLNVAITIGMMPVTGLPLPFLSYGGTFYITTMMCMGILLSVRARRGMFD